MSKTKRTVGDVLKHVRLRCMVLGNIIENYDRKERDSYLTLDEKKSYEIARSQMNELERLVSFIEGTGK